MSKRAVIFIMPRTSHDWQSAEALWVTVTGWALAAQRKYDKVYVVTRDAITDAQGVRLYPKSTASVSVTGKGLYSRLPDFIKTFIKDLILWKKSKQWQILDSPPWSEDQVEFIWEQHDLFPGAGLKLSRQLGVPLFSYVHAPNVWESRKWGVKRYLWGRFIEKQIEARYLKKCDLVACVSEAVKAKLIQMGVAADKVQISPMAVDQNLFDLPRDQELVRELKLENNLVVGWIGSFRVFHGLDVVVKAFAEITEKFEKAVLLFVGDGGEFEKTKALAKELKLEDKVIFTGQKPNWLMPKYVSLFDIALVSASTDQDFHYSPLKLREYMGAGVATIAPDAGEIPNMFTHNQNIKLYKAGNTQSLIDAISQLIEQAEHRNGIAKNGQKITLETNTWDVRLNRVIDFYFDNH